MIAGVASRGFRLVAPRGATASLGTFAVGLGALLLAWMLVLPPFGGSDEFDHAYRAAAAARGQWLVTPAAATRGTGAWLDVPADIVDAARPECQARIYTTPDDCVGTPAGADTVRIASGAGRYHPLFYAVVGTIALPFKGDTALYAMRLATAGLSLGLLVLAMLAARTWARSRLGTLGLVVATTPVALYSAAIVAPNGLEITAAIAFWSALVGLAVAEEIHVGRLLVIAAVAGTVLGTLRSLGPAWVVLVLLIVLIGIERQPGRLRRLAVRRDARMAAGAVLLSVVQGALWTMTMGALVLSASGGPPTSFLHRLGVAASFVPLWMLQTIAAFPMREDSTSPAVYACYLILFAGVLWGIRRSGRSIRRGWLSLAFLCLAVPVASTVASYDTVGAAWQGRYGMPLCVGLVILAGYGWDATGRTWGGMMSRVAPVLFVLAQAVSVGYTLHVEENRSPLAGSGAWLQPPLWFATTLAIFGAALVWRGAVPAWLPWDHEDVRV